MTEVTVGGDWRDFWPGKPGIGGFHITDPRPKGPDVHPIVPNGPPPTNPQPPTNGGGGAGTGTGSDPLSTLAAAYMASLGGSGGVGATAPIVIPAAAGGEGVAVNWTMIGALAAVALVLWAVYTWWKKHHGGGA